MGSQVILFRFLSTCENSQACCSNAGSQSSSLAQIQRYGRFGIGLYECWIV